LYETAMARSIGSSPCGSRVQPFMEHVDDGCAGLDMHKDVVVAAVRVSEPMLR